jgi:predicted transcriptional regulator
VVASDARGLMVPAQQSVLASASVVTTARCMQSLGVSSLPICGADNEFLGMVFERDIVQRCVAEAIDPREMAVWRVLNLPQKSVAADQPADWTLLRMIMEQPCGMLPVVDHGVLVGMITLAGIAAYLVEDEDIESGPGQMWWPGGGVGG